MTIKELIDYGNKYLTNDKVSLILSTILKINPLELSIKNEQVVSFDLVSEYKKVVSLIQEGKHIQYALTNSCFYGYDFFVNENVLIPRFETEELVYHTINYINKYFKSPLVLDMCTGSGCIGLTLKKECPSINVTLSDISEKALEVLKINQSNLNVSAEVVLGDLFENINSKYDILISNPPYVAYDDEIDNLVKNNEPEIALYANNNGLEMYERIFSECENYLNKRYMIAIEIGANQKNNVIDIINKNLRNVKIIVKNDANNRDRMLFVFKNVDLNE